MCGAKEDHLIDNEPGQLALLVDLLEQRPEPAHCQSFGSDYEWYTDLVVAQHSCKGQCSDAFRSTHCTTGGSSDDQTACPSRSAGGQRTVVELDRSRMPSSTHTVRQLTCFFSSSGVLEVSMAALTPSWVSACTWFSINAGNGQPSQ